MVREYPLIVCFCSFLGLETLVTCTGKLNEKKLGRAPPAVAPKKKIEPVNYEIYKIITKHLAIEGHLVYH
jgi:hypothetical protein